MSITNFKVP